MADLDYDHFDGGYRAADAGQRFGRVINLGGAALSVLLIVGGGVWAYQLAMRDVAGIPVIRALGGPLRIAPANPGGEEAMHQGLSVNAVAAAGTALPLPESLMLAPKSADLAEEDIAGLQPLEATGAEDAPLEVVAMAPAALLEAEALPEVLPETQEDAVAAALAEALGEDLGTDMAALSGDVMASPRPRSRSAGTAPAYDGMVQVSAPAVEVDPATIAVGTSLVQLGAFDDQETARAEWAKLSGRYGNLLADKAMVLQSAQSGGRTFYRLRAHGFASEDDARRFCTAMLAENATCIPVAQR